MYHFAPVGVNTNRGGEGCCKQMNHIASFGVNTNRGVERRNSEVMVCPQLTNHITINEIMKIALF
jgi:hypothetical protein